MKSIPPEFLEHYTFIYLLGTGGYAKVYLVTPKNRPHQKFALKIVDRPSDTDEWLSMKYLERETRLQSTFRHPNVLALHDILFAPHHIGLLLEYCSGGTLYDTVVNSPFAIKHQCRHLLIGILDGMRYLHSHGIAHRDIKPENILLDEHYNPKICDFGLAIDSKLTSTYCGSKCYIAPEVSDGVYDPIKADIFSFGIIMFVILTGCIPAKPGPEAVEAGNISPPYDKLICRCFNTDPSKRPDMSEMISIIEKHEAKLKINYIRPCHALQGNFIGNKSIATRRRWSIESLRNRNLAGRGIRAPVIE